MAAEEVVLVVMPAAWGLATACPRSLEVVLHLKLAEVSFAVRHIAVQPDAEDLPYLECKGEVGFASDTGGIEEFVRKQDLADLDSGLAEAELSDLRAYKEMVKSSLADAGAFELWLKENQGAANQAYFSSLPWPVNKALYWKQQRSVLRALGIKSVEAQPDVVADLYRKAAAAYQALSVRLQNRRYFINDRPTSLDAAVAAHLLFVLRAPFAASPLKEELKKHGNLMQYAESMAKYGCVEGVSAAVPNFSKTSSTAGKKSRRPPASSSTGNYPQDKAPKKRNEKEKMFRRRSKYFIVAQALSIVLYLAFVGIEYEDRMEDVGGDED